MDINFNWDLYDFGTEKIKFRLKVAYECFNHSTTFEKLLLFCKQNPILYIEN
jgi:hypothetical protein